MSAPRRAGSHFDEPPLYGQMHYKDFEFWNSLEVDPEVDTLASDSTQRSSVPFSSNRSFPGLSRSAKLTERAPVRTLSAPSPGRRRASPRASAAGSPPDSSLRVLPATFGGYAFGFLRRISECVGAFACYVRSARSAGQSPGNYPVSPLRKRSASALFPLPLVGQVQSRLPPNGRARRRIATRSAVVQLQNAMILFLNFEAAGRRREVSRTREIKSPAQRRVLDGLREAARAMLCPEVLRVSLKSLGLGRGKIAAGWDSLAAIQNSIRQLEASCQYRVSVPVGVPLVSSVEVAEDVDIGRVKLPVQAATVSLADYLTEPDVRAGFLQPSSLDDAAKDEFSGRACDRVPREHFGEFIRALDAACMLAAVRQPLGPPAGFFAVRKQWDAERGVWLLRLVLDRRPRNAQERLIEPSEDTMPHGTCFLEVRLGAQEQLRTWASDLPQWYYRMKVSAERARSNTFTAAIDAEAFRDTAAVQALLAAEGRGEGEPVGDLHFALATMAMGDINATTFAQCGHVELLRRFGAMPPDVLLTYRGVPPAGKVWEGVVIDDHAVAAAVPRRGWRRSRPARRARELFDAGRRAYDSIGVPDVDDKRQEGQRTAIIWGCELQGGRGRAGGPRVRRAALAALTLELCVGRVTTVDLLARLVGLWVDLLLYRRAAFAVLSAVYKFLHRYGDDDPRVPRTMPGVVVTELLGLACLAPRLDSPLRAPVDCDIKASDASPFGAAAVSMVVPQAAADELWRRRVRSGGRANSSRLGAPGNTRGDSAVGELLEGLPATELFRFHFGHKRPPHINVGEMRSRRALWRMLAQTPSAHGRRHLVAYDSSVTIGASNKGRSPSSGLMREARLTYPHLLAADVVEGAIWTDSERMPADAPSRGESVKMPAPQRAWASAFLQGDDGALAARFGEGHNPYAGVRVGEASHPGPRTTRTAVDLRQRALGTDATRERRERLLARLEEWLATQGLESLDRLAQQPPHLDRVLANYGQHLWSTDRSQGDFAETLNHVAKLYRWVRGQLGGAWDVRTAWQVMEPGENRAPVPPRLALALVTLFFLWEWREVAALVALGFEAALRPGDLLYLTRADLRFPQEHGGFTRALFVVLRHSKTRELRGARWQHVRVSCPVVVRILQIVFWSRDRDSFLFTCAGAHSARSRQLAAHFASGLHALDVPYGQAYGFTLAGLRAGGITAYFEATQNIDMTRWRGRWDSLRSLEHYVQELASHEAFTRLHPVTRARIFRLASLLQAVLDRLA